MYADSTLTEFVQIVWTDVVSNVLGLTEFVQRMWTSFVSSILRTEFVQRVWTNVVSSIRTKNRVSLIRSHLGASSKFHLLSP